MKSFKSALVAILLVIGSGIHALGIDLSPNANGTIDLSASHTLEWGSGLWSSFDVTMTSPMDVEEDTGLYVATSGTSLEASLDLIGFHFGPSRNFGVALNVFYSPSSINEVGYVDLSDSSRLFLVNDRHIEMFLPRLKGSIMGNAGPLSLSIEAELAPWYIVQLTQTLSTSTTGAPDKQTLTSPGTGNWASSADASLVIKGSFVSPELRIGFDSTPMAYSYLNVLGTETYLDSLIFDVRIMGGGKLDFLNFGGAAPRVMAGYEWNRVQDKSTGEWIVDDGEFIVSIGFSM